MTESIIRKFCEDNRDFKVVGGFEVSCYPRVECADGFSFDVVDHFGSYVLWDDDDVFVTHCQMSCISKEERLLRHYKEENNLYGYVPVDVVDEVIRRHGGLKSE